MFKLLLGILCVCVGIGATAEELCATKDTAAYAAHPDQGPKSPAKLQVVKGRSYSVATRISGWVGVQSGSEFGWASESAFSRCTSKNAGSSASLLAGTAAAAPKSSVVDRSSSAKSSPDASRKSASASSSVGGCPCGGGKVCVGPRGGRYCITSGGNKRYGV
jgi:hypothetical protein